MAPARVTALKVLDGALGAWSPAAASSRPGARRPCRRSRPRIAHDLAVFDLEQVEPADLEAPAGGIDALEGLSVEGALHAPFDRGALFRRDDARLTVVCIGAAANVAARKSMISARPGTVPGHDLRHPHPAPVVTDGAHVSGGQGVEVRTDVSLDAFALADSPGLGFVFGCAGGAARSRVSVWPIAATLPAISDRVRSGSGFGGPDRPPRGRLRAEPAGPDRRRRRSREPWERRDARPGRSRRAPRPRDGSASVSVARLACAIPASPRAKRMYARAVGTAPRYRARPLRWAWRARRRAEHQDRQEQNARYAEDGRHHALGVPPWSSMRLPATA